MPLTLTQEQFDDGRRYLRTWSEGAVTADDARAIAVRISAGGDLEGVPLLNVMAPKVDLSSEARKVFASISGASDREKSKMAVVASSCPVWTRRSCGRSNLAAGATSCPTSVWREPPI